MKIPSSDTIMLLSDTDNFSHNNMRGFRLYKRFFTSANTGKPALDKVGIFVFSSITLVTAGLGIWQLQRYDEKIIKIKETKKNLKNEVIRIHPEAITQESLTAALVKHRNQKVDLGRGTYMNGKEVFLGQRTGPSGRLGPRAQGMAINPQVCHLFGCLFVCLFACLC